MEDAGGGERSEECVHVTSSDEEPTQYTSRSGPACAGFHQWTDCLMNEFVECPSTSKRNLFGLAGLPNRSMPPTSHMTNEWSSVW